MWSEKEWEKNTLCEFTHTGKCTALYNVYCTCDSADSINGLPFRKGWNEVRWINWSIHSNYTDSSNIWFPIWVLPFSQTKSKDDSHKTADIEWPNRPKFNEFNWQKCVSQAERQFRHLQQRKLQIFYKHFNKLNQQSSFCSAKGIVVAVFITFLELMQYKKYFMQNLLLSKCVILQWSFRFGILLDLPTAQRIYTML